MVWRNSVSVVLSERTDKSIWHSMFEIVDLWCGNMYNFKVNDVSLYHSSLGSLLSCVSLLSVQKSCVVIECSSVSRKYCSSVS